MANLKVYDPFENVWDLSDQINRMFWGPQKHRENREFPAAFNPPVDVTETDQAITLRAELPGLKKEDVNIKVREGVLTISGEKKKESEVNKENYYRVERSFGSFARSYHLPNTVDTDKIRASMKEGVLELSIPKKPEAQEKEINIELNQ